MRYRKGRQARQLKDKCNTSLGLTLLSQACGKSRAMFTSAASATAKKRGMPGMSTKSTAGPMEGRLGWRGGGGTGANAKAAIISKAPPRSAAKPTSHSLLRQYSLHPFHALLMFIVAVSTNTQITHRSWQCSGCLYQHPDHAQKLAVQSL